MNLAGDIGGTHARFGLFDEGKCQQLLTLDMAQQGHGTSAGGDLVEAALVEFGRPSLDRLCLAVAGPVLGDEARLTNHPMAFSRTNLRERVGVKEVLLVNDLVALGTAVANGHADNSVRLSGNDPNEPNATRCVLGAGTGLGMCVIVDGQCLPSEGGHARVAPAGAFERELIAYTEATLEEARGVVAWEHYLSGRGLVNLHRAVCHVWDIPAAHLAPEEIVARGLEVTDPTCHAAIETWASMLATAAGSLAVTCMALGGVWLAGAVPRAIKPTLSDRPFCRSFETAAWAADFLPTIPVHLIEADDAGLIGASMITTDTGNH